MANQLYIKEHSDKKNIFPKNYTDNIRDKESNKTLTEILQGFNCYFLSYTGNVETTRLQVPKLLRKQGLWITYVDYENNTITEYYDNPNIEDSKFKDSSNWREGNNRLVGDLSISANGNWVINGIETKYKAKGETGETPLLRYYNNILQASYNKGNNWKDITSFTNNLGIHKYVSTKSELPNSASLGTIYAVGPETDEEGNDYYRLYTYAYDSSNTLKWVDNGLFKGITAGIVNDLTTGGADKALSAEMGKELDGKLAELESETKNKALSTEARVNRIDSNIGFNKDDSFYIVDTDGNAIAKIDKDGLQDVNIDPSMPDQLAICDKQGYVIAKFDKDGIHGLKTKEATIEKLDNGNTPSGIMLNIIYGQSLTYHGSLPSGLDMYSMLKFDNQFDYSMSDCTNEILNSEELLNEYMGESFVKAVTSGYRGTAAAHANRKYMELLRDENGIDIQMEDGIVPVYQFQLLNIRPSDVNAWYELANRDSIYYKRLLAAVRYGKKFANELGLSFSVGSLMYMQGESNADNADSVKMWYDKLWAMFSIINKDVKEITGQSNDVLFMPYQMASHEASAIKPNGSTSNLALAELQISLDEGAAESDYVLSGTAKGIMSDGDVLIDRKNIQMGAIMVSLDYASDTDHLHATEHSYLAAGAQFGIQMKRCIYDGNPIKPIHPKSHTISSLRNGKYLVELKFHVPCKPLVIDISNGECQSQRATLSNKGFSIVKNGKELIESVKAVGNDGICILCSENPAGLSVEYAKDGWEIGGNLRDSQDITYTINNFVYNAHNWCPIFKYNI